MNTTSTSTDDLLGDSVAALFADHATPAAVRTAATAGVSRGLWQHVADSGFDRALAPESVGGSGLSLREVCGLLQMLGRYAAPLPLGEAIFAHALAGSCGERLPEGPISAALASSSSGDSGGAIVAHAVPWGASSDWVLAVEPNRMAYLMPVAKARIEPPNGFRACNETDMTWQRSDVQTTFEPRAGTDWMSAGACLRAAQIAGALDSVLTMTTQFVGERSQFHRTLSKFQAIQQQIAVLAEDSFASRIAAELACDTANGFPDPLNAAAAKVWTSTAASRACAIAHAVHGAMGIAAEHDLHLYTGRLLGWRVQYGSESYWSPRIGSALLGESCSAWDFVRRSSRP